MALLGWNSALIRTLSLCILSFVLASHASAATVQKYSDSMSLGAGFIYIDSKQLDMNGAIDDANSIGAGVPNLGHAWEFYAQWTTLIQYSNLTLIIRPSYFEQSSHNGSTLYKLSGTTIFPIVRMHVTDLPGMNLFIQGGVGYGQLNGEIDINNKTLNFSGNGLGVVAGVGADTCMNDRHCFNLELNLRNLSIPRNTSAGGNCVNNGDIPGITRCYVDSEVERNYSDLKTNMSGTQMLLGYFYRY